MYKEELPELLLFQPVQLHLLLCLTLILQVDLTFITFFVLDPIKCYVLSTFNPLSNPVSCHFPYCTPEGHLAKKQESQPLTSLHLSYFSVFLEFQVASVLKLNPDPEKRNQGYCTLIDSEDGGGFPFFIDIFVEYRSLPTKQDP